MKVELYLGDITSLEVEAIVNAANNEMWMGAGVAGAIKRVGGSQIEDEAVKKGPIAVGQALATGAGKLKAKHVLHAAVMAMDFKTDEKKIRHATRNTLVLANKLKLRCIAFPALGTGVGKFPMEQAAQIMLEEVQQHLETETTLQKVIFALRTQDAMDTFYAVLNKMEPKG